VKCLVVVAHPLAESLCATLAQKTIATLGAAGHEIQVLDLYQNGFTPALSLDERKTYYGRSFDANAVQSYADQLLSAEALILLFPTWWFGPPAILKGWFDRVWAPGIAYYHASDLGPIRPRLLLLRRALAITSLGAPWWVDRVVMRQPVKRLLGTAILGTCAPACEFEMLSLYKSERLESVQIHKFCARIEKALLKWA
jgi:NAD(P)H dehydrogenase (quinone)